MEVCEYLQQVLDQMRCKKAKGLVSKEMEAHIEDQAQIYEEFGMNQKDALERAVEQMGDPVEVGTALDRIHRPKFDLKMVCIVFLFSIGGFILQLAFQSTSETSNTSSFLYYGIGIFIMMGIMLIDYSFMGKYPMIIWIALNLSIFLWGNINLSFGVYQGSGNLTLLNAALILSFSGLVYYLRNKKYKGIIGCLFYLAIACFLMMINNQRITPTFTLFFVGIFILSFAVHKGWYQVSKWKGQMLIWASWVIPFGLLTTLLFSGIIGRTYQTERVRSFFLYSQEVGGANYITSTFRDLMKSLSWMKENEMWGVNGWESMGIGYEFSWLLNKYGILPAFIIITLIVALLGYMAAKLFKQQNRLGVLLGVAVIGTLGFSMGLHLLVSLTLAPPTSSFLPFISPDGMGTVAMYLFLGVYLSIYRHQTIIGESNAKPSWKIKIEKVK